MGSQYHLHRAEWEEREGILTPDNQEEGSFFLCSFPSILREEAMHLAGLGMDFGKLFKTSVRILPWQQSDHQMGLIGPICTWGCAQCHTNYVK